MNFDWTINLGQAVTALTTFLVSVIALFQKPLRRWYYRPRLSIEFRSEPPYLQSFTRLPEDARANEHERWVAYRIALNNQGRGAAEDVRVFVSNVEVPRDGEHGWRELTPFISVELLWTHVETPVRETVPAGYYLFVNFFSAFFMTPMNALPKVVAKHPRVNNGDIGLVFHTMVQSPIDHYNIVGSGTYRVHLTVTGSNVKTFTQCCVLTVREFFERINDRSAAGNLAGEDPVDVHFE